DGVFSHGFPLPVGPRQSGAWRGPLTCRGRSPKFSDKSWHHKGGTSSYGPPPNASRPRPPRAACDPGLPYSWRRPWSGARLPSLSCCRNTANRLLPTRGDPNLGAASSSGASGCTPVAPAPAGSNIATWPSATGPTLPRSFRSAPNLLANLSGETWHDKLTKEE